MHLLILQITIKQSLRATHGCQKIEGERTFRKVPSVDFPSLFSSAFLVARKQLYL